MRSLDSGLPVRHNSRCAIGSPLRACGPRSCALFLSLCWTLLLPWSGLAVAELQPETIGKIEKLPVPYPPHWIIAHDAAFFHMLEGKMIVLDALAKTLPEQYKGMFNSSNIGAFAQATVRPEMYVAEVFYSRGSRGTRTDVLTIYDKETLGPIGEIELPDKRALILPEKYAMQLIDQERLLLVFNFTPATSVSVVDIVARKLVGEIDISGCALVYPSGGGFSSLCSDGSMLSVQLDSSGQETGRQRSEPFFDVNDAPLFEKPAIIGGIAYFPSFQGEMHPVDLRAAKVKPLASWSLVSEEERGQGWRPGGWQIIGADVNRQVYILMHPEGYDGSHKDGGPEVWVYDVEQKRRLRRIPLKQHGISIALNRQEDPLLLVTNADMNIDVYRASSGEHVNSLTGFGQETPFVVYAPQ